MGLSLRLNVLALSNTRLLREYTTAVWYVPFRVSEQNASLPVCWLAVKVGACLTSMPLHCVLPGREEREQRRQDIEHLAASLVNKVNECVGALDEGTALVQT